MKLFIQMKGDGVETELNTGKLKIASTEDGVRPNELMLASIAGCSLAVFRNILQKQRVEFNDLAVDAEITERNEDKANRIESINLDFKVKGKDLKLEKLEKNLVLSQKHCPMVATVKGCVDITHSIVIEE